jgi:hypothetical protein
MAFPTIGRVVYYRLDSLDIQDPSITSLDPTLPFRADVAFVDEPNSTVNLKVVDHFGRPFARTSVPFFDQQQPDSTTAHAHWMPYQLAQAAAGQAAPTPVA